MFRNSHQRLWIKSRYRGDRLHPYGNIIISTFQPHRSFILTKCRSKQANINSTNYYDLLGVERTATQKEIRKAFVKLSKEYHPDSNSSDKSLHEKFVKINEAFGVLSKSSTRTTYDQTLDSTSRPSYQAYSTPHRRPETTGSPFDWTQTDFKNRGAYQRRSNPFQSDRNTSQFDKTFFDMLRRRMEQDRQRAKSNPYSRPPAYGMINTYFAPFSILSFLIGFGILIHVLQWRLVKFSESNYAVDPRSRSYHAYREWQRLSALKDAKSMPMRDSSSIRNEEEEK